LMFRAAALRLRDTLMFRAAALTLRDTLMFRAALTLRDTLMFRAAALRLRDTLMFRSAALTLPDTLMFRAALTLRDTLMFRADVRTATLTLRECFCSKMAHVVSIGNNRFRMLPVFCMVCSGRRIAGESCVPHLPMPTKVLIVEDDNAMAQMCAKLIRRRGHTVVIAGSGQDALAMIRQAADIDVVISDVQMPQMSGMQLLVRLRALDANLPIILM